MIDKRRIRYSVRRLQRVKTWQLIVLLILMSFVTATFLRLNNIGMIERRSAVVSADDDGVDSETQDRLYDLQRYVTAHMNTDLGKGIYLESAYKRDVQSAYSKASNDSSIYKKAQEYCAPRFSSWSQAYVQCTLSELAKYPGGYDLKLPYADSYLHVFASPTWSPDFAGWSLLICVVIFIMIITRLTSVGILKLILKYNDRGI